MTGRLNLLIPQGTDYYKLLSFKHTLRNALALPLSASPIPMYLVSPLDVALSSGFVLDFGPGVTATLQASASVGDKQLSVVTTGKIAKESLVYTLPENLTGNTYRAKILDKFGSLTPLATFTCTVESAVNGQIQFYLPSLSSSPSATSSTDAIPANILQEQVPDDIQDDDAFDAAVFKKGYRWDLEEITGSGKVNRRLEGRVFCTAQATV